jgi:hypothetical protein
MNGRTYLVEYHADDDSGPPWEDCDGHGEVTDYTHRDKHPGERVLYADRSWRRFYDVAATMRIARRDGWGLSADELVELTRCLGRTPTRRQIVARAVELDFDHLRGWCNNDWHYIGVTVTERESGIQRSLWGVEDNDKDYVDDVEHELAHEIEYELAAAAEAMRRAAEVAHCAVCKRRADILDITRALVR